MNRFISLAVIFLTASASRAQDNTLSPKSVDLGPLGEYFTVLRIDPYAGAVTPSGVSSMLLQLQARKGADTSEFERRFKLGAFDGKNHLYHTAFLSFEHAFALERGESVHAFVEWPFGPEVEVRATKFVVRRVKQR